MMWDQLLLSWRRQLSSQITFRLCAFLNVPNSNRIRSQSFYSLHNINSLCAVTVWFLSAFACWTRWQPPATIIRIGVPHLTIFARDSRSTRVRSPHDKKHLFRDGRGPAPIFSLFCSRCPEFVVRVRAPPMIACLYREATGRPADVTLFSPSLCADGLKQPGCGGDEEEPLYFPQRLPQHGQSVWDPPGGGAAQWAARTWGPPTGQEHRRVHWRARWVRRDAFFPSFIFFCF